MLFCNTTFCGLSYTFDTTPTNVIEINDIQVQNGIYDELYVADVTSEYNPQFSTDIPSVWEDNTVLHARFDNNLLAGNVNFDIDQTTAVIIKRRAKGKDDWLNIARIPISSPQDFSFEIFDKYARSGVEYEYALVPVFSNNEEGYLNPKSILSEFEGLFIIEKDMSYHALINIKMSSSKNRPTAVINTIDSLYPYVITNGRNNYYTGSTAAVFTKTKSGLKHMYDWDFYNENNIEYREQLMDFLCDGDPKVLKHFDGRMYLISVIDNPMQDEGVSNYYPTTTFNWVEIGNAENMMDLYNNNLTDYDGQSVGGA